MKPIVVEEQKYDMYIMPSYYLKVNCCYLIPHRVHRECHPDGLCELRSLGFDDAKIAQLLSLDEDYVKQH